MSFAPNAVEIAEELMNASGYSDLAKKFAGVIRFLQMNSTVASPLRGKNRPEVGTLEYLQKAGVQFAEGRTPKTPSNPKTIPDQMVSFILQHYFDVPEIDLERIKSEHALSMVAENIVGELLERYLADGLETQGWIWVTGALIKGVDFLKPPHAKKDKWLILQVKNRDNSENSSSSAIRNGTEISKWFRTFSKREGSNWENFPDIFEERKFSEKGFEKFVRKHLKSLKLRGA